MKTTFYTILFVLFLSTAAFAVPYLQLDASDGAYDTGSETIVSTSDTFTLYALVNTGTSDDYIYDPTDKYYISMALTPKVSTPGTYGSFSFDGTPYNVTADMEFGTPPLDPEFNDLPDHDIFETYYAEVDFSLGVSRAAEYNSQDIPGGLVDDARGTLAYAAFDVDVTTLDPAYEIHFDLYTVIETSNSAGKIFRKIDKFAPFSHDAESGGDGDTPDSPVPEPATLFLLGFGLLGIAGVSRKKSV